MKCSPKCLNLVSEPVEKWQSTQGSNLLSLHYSDPKRWGLTFQNFVSMTLGEQHIELNNSTVPINIMERSVYSANYCFVENLFSKLFILL